jgi:hypothetical protein
MKKKAEAVLLTGKEADAEGKAGRTKCLLLPVSRMRCNAKMSINRSIL